MEIPREELIKEHKHLVKVLEHGNPSELKKEATKQKKELHEYKEHEELISKEELEDFGF
jgi:hypothetical protein